MEDMLEISMDLFLKITVVQGLLMLIYPFINKHEKKRAYILLRGLKFLAIINILLFVTAFFCSALIALTG
ncbi:MAG: hypothetical protein F6K24_02040 [Okeania sp. SIO2D1]|nr:hypothetical protein [Okeania sp. SIO2D1]